MSSEKNNKKNVIVIMVSLILITFIILGLTYTYYRTRIIGNSKDKTIDVLSEILELTYSDNNSYINISNLEPGVKFKKPFTVTNTGNKKIEDY